MVLNSNINPAALASMSSAELADLLLMITDAEDMRRSLKKFVVGAWPMVEPAPFKDGWVVDALCDHLEALTRGQIRFLLINVPPRHSKSTICTTLWPVWCWLQDPTDRFLCASYSLRLAIRDNLKKRTLIESKWFKDRYGRDFSMLSEGDSLELLREQDFALSAHQNAKQFFMNDRMGYQLAVSVGSTTTGEGGSKLLIDDPHSAMEAHSDAERESALTWFRETWSNRMNDAEKDAMIVIGQRIHENDVSGIILKERPDWVHLDLPAEYEPARKCFTSIGWSDPRTVEGELLWPERFTQETLNRYKRDLGSLGYAAQYQQTPVPSTGGTFKHEWFRYFTEVDDTYFLEKSAGIVTVPKSQCWRFTVVDLAISSKQTADYTVIQTYDVTPQNDLLLIDQIRERLDNPSQQKTIRAVYMQLHPLFVKIEAVGYQLALIQQLRDSPIQTGDFLVETNSPAMLEQTLRQLPMISAFLVRDQRGNYIEFNGCNVVRVSGDQNFFRFACEKQGYCRIIDQVKEGDAHGISIPIREYRPVRDKVTRATVAAIQMENEKIHFRKNAPYLDDLKAELLRFPRGAHDDQVDDVGAACDEVVSPSDGGNIPMVASGGNENNVSLPVPVQDTTNEELILRQQLIARIMNGLGNNRF
jgi:hypothetical protein